MVVLPSITTTDMEPEFSSQQLNGTQKAKCNNSLGIRVVGNRIYDSSNGTTCHQCRQKTRDFAATCKNPRNGKPCVIKLCHKCLLNRYGEKAEEVALLSDWKCPKCRGICNCSCCMKKRGQQPTGPLVHTAKASGFKSVSEMLNTTGNLELTKVNNAFVLPTKEAITEKGQKCVDDNVFTSKAVLPITSEKELVVILPGEAGKENSLDENGDLEHDALKVQKTSPEKSKRKKREELKEISNGSPTDVAGQNKRLKRPNENHIVVAKVFHTVSENETEVNKNHNPVCGVKGGLEARVANDFFFDPMTLASEMHQNNGNNTMIEGDGGNAGNKFQTDRANSLKLKKCVVDSEGEKNQEEIPLPPGVELTEILDIEFPPEDVGNALQFLEFCRVFRKALDVKKGEGEAILRELVRKQTLRRGQNTLVVQFQIRLLTVILIDSGDESPSLATTNGSNSWLEALEDLITESDLVLKDFPLDWLKEGIGGYYDLDLSKKLTLLNFICDEALSTEKLRSYIEDQNSKNSEERKEAKLKVATAKEKEKSLKQKLQDEMAKAIMPNEASLSISEHDALILKIKSEAAQAHIEMLEAKGTIPKRKQTSDAMRIELEFLDSSGHAFWKLKSYDDEHVLLQDIKVLDAVATATNERWFVYGPEKKGEIDKYISLRAKGPKIRKVTTILPNESIEANM